VPTCFVMQRFDKDVHDRRYEEVYAPAIRDAGLEPYRVDHDPACVVPIQDIEAGIRSAEMCFAEISTDSPNVWFEVGYAFASGKDVVLVSVDPRPTHYPFDIQHRQVIRYKTDSPSDFEALKKEIIKRIRAVRDKAERMGAIAEGPAVLKPTEGLTPAEIVTLAATAESVDYPGEGVYANIIKNSVEHAGYTKLASSIALHGLLRRKYLAVVMKIGMDEDAYPVYAPTDAGMDWLEANKDKLVLRKAEPVTDDDEVPF